MTRAVPGGSLPARERRAPDPRLVLATRNPGKVREITAIYAGLDAEVGGLQEWPALGALPEEGDTYAANAASKARAVARATGHPALADDSGVEIDALGGAPGVRSARFLGEAASDADRNAAVLARLAGLPAARRTARYRAVVAIATPDGRVETFEGVCEGAIAERPRGAGGFGYDPIFEIAGNGRTMAEVPPEVKNQISHRARALRAARPAVERVLGVTGRTGKP
ncbi:MAG TPA: RdgB/HAM1 family non-canonical purine NTP pyrophosphatase [bacterium]|nr:RdgB/HAM1 family non-canonical purine NTP pyrophosphatase [bacterium]